MPHDKNGTLLSVGDEVNLRCKITAISDGETQCNITAEAAERPDGEGYIPSIAGNSRFYEKASAPETASDQFAPLSDDDVIADKQLRVAIDVEIQRLKSITDKEFTGFRSPDAKLRPSRERALAITKLQEAVMWLGMDLKRLGTPNPYPNSKDPSNTVVDPTADGLKL